ncbi:MAG: 1-deoxy-D-xylulose-5-phosphate reductoisomerase [Pseudomonadota bacterium]
MKKGRSVSVLGSTGSIGVNCLDVINRFPEEYHISALAAGRNVELLARQVQAFRPRVAAVLNRDLAAQLEKLVGPRTVGEIVYGDEGFELAASLAEVHTVVSAMVGAAGLRPTWAAVRAGKKIALANKEVLVAAGELVMAEARSTGSEIIPVDSEHSAIFQALAGHCRADVHRVILTASGGPFRDWDRERLAKATPRDALAHPNWAMGAKISIDSATLMNKGLETIEARWLFDLPWDKIEIHVHPQSIVHSLVEFVDGSVLAQLGVPDMRLPIAYALSHPRRLPLDLPRLDLPEARPLTFSRPDLEKFPCLELALRAGRRGGLAPAALNAANEEAVRAFLSLELSFTDISKVSAAVLERTAEGEMSGLDQVFQADREARKLAREFIAGQKGVHCQ